MIIVMEEGATEGQVSKVIENLVNLGFDIHRSTGATYTILGAVSSRPVRDSDVRAMEMLEGVRDVVRVSGPSVKKIRRQAETSPNPSPAVYFNHITIFGVGLIGGSFALAARNAGIAGRITGCGDRKYLEAALSYKVIDGVDEAFENDALSDADLIYLAAPVGSIIEFLRARGRCLKEGAIVTDAGSAKREICRAANELLPSGVRFVGGHPMAGSHRVGVEFANADLFKNTPYVLIETGASQASQEALEKLTRVVTALGSRIVKMTPESHDAIVARVSHAPQLLSTALATAVRNTTGESALKIAGNGFADMTRLARSDWSVWEDIVRVNADEITAALTEVIDVLRTIRDEISEKEFSSLKKAFESANDFLLES